MKRQPASTPRLLKRVLILVTVGIAIAAGGCGDHHSAAPMQTAVGPTDAFTPTPTATEMPTSTSTATPTIVALDPNKAAPYAVGSTIETFVRPSNTTDELRELRTVIWYPAPPDADGDTILQGGLRDVPLAEGRPFPLLVFSHGSCGVPGQSKFLATRLASYGFIVAAPPHPGNTAFDNPSRERCLGSRYLADSFFNRPGDIRYVIDRLLDLSAGDGRFAGAIDGGRIGVFGHSFGGQTVLRVAAADDRVDAVLSLAPGATNLVAPQVDNIVVAAMIQAGEKDSIAPFAVNDRPAYDLLEAPRFLVEILNTGHFAFADTCFSPTGTEYPDCAAGTLTQEEAHAFILRFAIPFFERYVAGDARWAPWLEPGSEPAGVVDVAEP